MMGAQERKNVLDQVSSMAGRGESMSDERWAMSESLICSQRGKGKLWLLLGRSEADKD